MPAAAKLLLLATVATWSLTGGEAQGACRTAQITFTSAAADGALVADYSPRPYGRGILCVRHRVSAESLSPVSWRVTRGANSCDPSHPSFNDTHALAPAAAEQPLQQRRQAQDFPPVCGANMAPGTDCQESVMWCSASLWQPFGVHLEAPGVAPYCQLIRCGGEAEAEVDNRG
jgi:hypothetical protein